LKNRDKFKLNEPLIDKKKNRNNILTDFNLMNDEDKEKFIAVKGEELNSNQKNATFYPGCEEKLVDVDLRKDSKSVQKLIQMNTKARVFTEDSQLNQL